MVLFLFDQNHKLIVMIYFWHLSLTILQTGFPKKSIFKPNDSVSNHQSTVIKKQINCTNLNDDRLSIANNMNISVGNYTSFFYHTSVV